MSVPSAATTAFAPGRRRKAAVLITACLLLAALGVRAWHDTHRPPSFSQGMTKADLQQAAARAPSDPNVWRSLAELYDQEHENAAAVAAYEHLTRLRPDDAVAWRQLGVLYAKTGRSAQGREALEHAAKLDPADIRTQNDLATAVVQSGRLSEARTFYERVLAQHPDDPKALSGLAQITLQLDPSPEGTARAEQLIDRALTLHPTGEAHLTRGHLYLLRRRYGAAISELNAALALNADLLPAYGYLAQAYTSAGQPARAQEAENAYQAAFDRRIQQHERPARQGTPP
jgi:Flp pilus assembly protein TadD